MSGPPRRGPLRFARTCHGHLAGTVGVAVTAAMLRDGLLVPAADAYRVSVRGRRALESLGIAVESREPPDRRWARPCLDWTERTPHLGGLLGRALAARLLELEWVERLGPGRALRLTAGGEEGLRSALGVSLETSTRLA